MLVLDASIFLASTGIPGLQNGAAAVMDPGITPPNLQVATVQLSEGVRINILNQNTQ